jgi:hypothetical protein
MSASASLPTEPLAVDPGGEQSCWIKIRNTGEIVDEFVFEVLGAAAEWTELDAPSLSLFPGEEKELKVTFRPPRRSTTPAGTVPFGLKVASRKDPDDAVVEEGLLEVAPFEQTAAELTPRTSRGRFRGKHELAFDNRGNAAVNAKLEGTDADDLLTFRFDPPALAAAPGTATFVKVKARPRKRFWRGAPKTLPFQVKIEPEHGEPRTADGALLQESLLPKSLLPVLAVLAGLAAVWALFLKPQIESTARDAVKAPITKIENKIVTGNQSAQANAAKAAAASATKASDAASKSADAASKSAGAASQSAADAAAAAKQVGKTAQSAANAAGKAEASARLARQKVQVVPGPVGTPTNFRLEVTCADTCTATRAVSRGTSLALTDVVFGNPNADSGTLTLKRGTTVLFSEGLENFRDLDFHFVAPIVVKSGEQLTLDLKCTNSSARVDTAASAETQGPAGPCSPAVSLAGFVRKATPHPQP